MFMRAVVALALCAIHASADGLSELKARLEGLQGQEPVKASVEHQIWSREGDAKHPQLTQGKASAWVEDSAQGIKIFWNRGLMQQAAQEAREHTLHPERPQGTRRAMESLSALDLAERLSSAGHLVQSLDQAQLLEDRQDTLEGKPARLLVCKLSPRFSERERKYIKEFEATARIWLGEDGYPMAAETHTRVKGRALLVVSFQSEQSETFRFAKVGRRLVTVQHVQESTGSGGGESGQNKQTTSITVAG